MDPITKRFKERRFASWSFRAKLKEEALRNKRSNPAAEHIIANKAFGKAHKFLTRSKLALIRIRKAGGMTDEQAGTLAVAINKIDIAQVAIVTRPPGAYTTVDSALEIIDGRLENIETTLYSKKIGGRT